QKYNNCGDVVFGNVVSGRPPGIEGIERMVGLFINTVPVRIKGKENITVSRLVKEIHEESLVLRNYEYLSLAEIQANTCLGGELLDHIMVFENYPIETEIINASLEQELGFSVEKMEVREQTNYDFVLLLAPGKCLLVKFIFNSLTFDIEFVKCIERHFKEVIGQVVKNPGIDIKEIRILPEDEKRRILEEFNDTSVEFPDDKTIHDLFLEQMEKTPGNIALVFEDQQISYGELNRKANQLAHLLKEKGVLADDIVGIMVERSVEMIVGILAILRAGGAYLPIDPEYPEERKQYMLADSDARILLTNLSEGHHFHHSSNQFSTHHSGNLAYVIYTSGTTGQPKGTLVTHCNVNRVVKNTNYIELYANDRILQLSNYAFDGSVFDIYGALLNGAALVMLEQEKVLAVDQLAEVISNKQVTVFFVTTALFNALVDIRIDCFKNIRKVLFGGERVSVEHSRKALEYLGKDKIIHVYGPTETTVYATYYFIDTIDEACSTIPIGAPIANTTAYILDSYLHPVPVGVAGEVYIGGDGVARGYLNNPELTSEKFIDLEQANLFPTPYSPTHPLTHSTKYRTGDLARWLPEGNIEFLGRIDLQVKLRGYRVELGEIETRLLNHPAVKEAVVIVREDKTGDKQLCAYVVYREPTEFTGLREFLARTLPDYMIPGFFVTLDKIPLTANGKVDRKSLPEPGLEGRSEYIAPRDEVEKKLVEIWKGVLGLGDDTSIGIEDNFFDLGGHSLKATILAAKIYREFQVRITLGQIFQTPTIRGISGFIKKTGRSRFIAVIPVEEKEYYPLSSAQKQFYVMQQLDPNTTAYNISSLLTLVGAIEKEILADIIIRLIQRHETLRTSFEIVNGEPVQRVHDNVEFKIEYYNFATESTAVTGDKGNIHNAKFIIQNSLLRPFDLSQAPLLKVVLIKLEENKHIFMADMHHILSDLLSQEILVNEVVAFYSGISLPGLKLQYRDYAHWQNRQAMSGEIRKQEEYWFGELRGDIPVLEIPTDFPRPRVKSFEGSRMNFELDGDVARKLANLAGAENATLFMLYLAVVYVLLNKLSGREDIIVGTIVAGRRHPDLENIIGAFINTLTLRNYPKEDKTFRQFLREVRKRTLEAFDNQDYRFEDLVQKVMINRDTSRNPLFDILYSFAARDASGAIGAGTSGIPVQYNSDLRVEPYGGGEAADAKFDITIAGGGAGDHCSFFIEYSTKLFKKETMQRYISYFKEIAVAAAKDADILLKDIIVSTDLSVVAVDVYDEQSEFEF
ncbi:MAG: amino acid adenylation domain-containing protein, partial [Candidatus Aminicenantes bacterium]|nr:amino acid adenylation domain-containing protein [Candidatus Aminicenantes bacterium]NIM82034.1 amino acid adenylation domain-containing protein [Candidatus Aminicenantes bacterium]NIN21418.1 amino acid adenylation domain-containing protein [Candidatus Aminicenantes bacterium]NIN45245.1 amino acid adenylation domain-containing protein [Candidatus Aminicenantes bacterium]NIN88065.1 amino acid adenylation domain-containing protein [Candidatus Aminicenantes bacterium]